MPQSTSATILRHRNSIDTPTVIKLTITKSNLFCHHLSNYPKIVVVAAPTCSSTSLSSSPSFCYTSLRDVIPSSAMNSPTSAIAAGHLGYEIAIRNLLVKQAAWAYLQPMSAYPNLDAESFFRRVWVKFSVDL